MASASLIIGIVLIANVCSSFFFPLGAPIPIRLISIVGLVLTMMASRKKRDEGLLLQV